MYIQSKQNAQLKLWKKLHTSKGRKQYGKYLIEGEHLIEEAIKCVPHLIETLVIRSDMLSKKQWLDETALSASIVTVSPECFEMISQTEHSQGLMAVMLRPTDINEFSYKRSLLVDRVQDPGNLGTIIRIADAAGCDAVVLGRGCVDLYNDKVIRATQGSLWHIDILQQELEILIPQLQKSGTFVMATALHQKAMPYNQLHFSSNSFAVIVGNEGSGVSPELIDLADQSIYIPMFGKAESLNVAVATGIVLFEFVKYKA